MLDRSTNLSNAAPSRRNSFDTIRMFAAFCVLISHGLGMAGYEEPSLGPLGITLSSTGLYIFFGLSGYLIFKSLERNRRLSIFLWARVCRIYPAWVMNIIFCVVFGAAITTLPQTEFWSDKQTLLYLFDNIPVMTTPSQFYLPGVFQMARWPAINGSIWTVKYEIICYLMLYTIYEISVTLGLSRKSVFAATMLFSLFSYIWYTSLYERPSNFDFFSYYNYFNLSRFLMTFLAGATYSAAEPISDRWRTAAVALPGGLICFAPTSQFARAGLILLLALLVIEVGKTELFHSFLYYKVGDLSYGTFLYAYPIQNYITSRFFNGHNILFIMTISIISILSVAFLSWRLIESPCLRFKQQAFSPLN